jgi:hypothetical protein
MLKHAKYVFIILSLMLSSCAGKVRVEEMVYIQKSASFSKWSETIYIHGVEGSQSSNELVSTPGIDNKDFKIVVERSLNSAGLIAKSEKLAPYYLDVLLMNTHTPSLGGIDVHATAQINYRLFDKVSNRDLLNQSITSQYTAPFSAAYAFPLRVRRALEGAIKANMEQVIHRINGLELPLETKD